MSGSRRRPGRLGSHVDGYRAWLFDRGYSSGSVTRSLGALGHVGRWMDRHDVDVGELDSDVLNSFLADHVDRYGQLPSAGVMPLLEYLRSAGVAAAEPILRCSSLTSSSVSTGTGWLVSERSRLTRSAGTRGWHAGPSRNASRSRMSSGSSGSPEPT